MDCQKVDSSHIASVGYDSGTRTLHIEFTNGDLYEYRGVPSHVYAALANARSAGSAFHKLVKPHFAGVKI